MAIKLFLLAKKMMGRAKNKETKNPPLRKMKRTILVF